MIKHFVTSEMSVENLMGKLDNSHLQLHLPWTIFSLDLKPRTTVLMRASSNLADWTVSLYITALERHYNITISLNMHNM
jgi:hypothetical protein